MSEKKSRREGDTLPDPTQALREMYDKFWKQAESQWDEALRHPQVLAAMAASIEQSQNLTARVQQLVAATLKTLNLPTRDDIRALTRSLNDVRHEITEMNRKLDQLTAASGAKKVSTKQPAKKRATRKPAGEAS